MSLCCLWNEHWLGLSLATGLLLLVLLFSNWADSDAIPALDVPLLPGDEAAASALVPCAHRELSCRSAAESQNDIKADHYNVSTKVAAGQIPCYDPATMQMLGFMPAMSKEQVSSTFRAECSMPACPSSTCLAPLPRRSRTLCRRPVPPLRYAWLRVMSTCMISCQLQAAYTPSLAQEWRHSSFRKRKLLLKTILKYIVDHKVAICRSASRTVHLSAQPGACLGLHLLQQHHICV